MSNKQLSPVESYIASASLSDVEAKIIRTVLAKQQISKQDQIKSFLSRHLVTVGFTVDQLDTVLEAHKKNRELSQAGGLIGWMFRFDKQNPLIDNIKVSRLDLSFPNENATFTEVDLTYLDDDNKPQSVTITPRIFVQQRTVDTNESDLPYPDAFAETSPFSVPLTGISMKQLQGYFPWADLAMLQRSDIDNFVDFMLSDATAYNDVFFSGANINYATMQNPRMRIEQVNLRDSLTRALVPQDERNTPFTLKAEPYIATPDVSREWLPLPPPPTQAPPVVTPVPQSLNRANSAAPAGGTSQTIPMAATMLPCPTLWDVSGQASAIALRTTDSSDPAVLASFYATIMKGLTEGTLSQKGGVAVNNVTLKDVQNTQKTPPNKGCLTSFVALLSAAIILWLAWW